MLCLRKVSFTLAEEIPKVSSHVTINGSSSDVPIVEAGAFVSRVVGFVFCWLVSFVGTEGIDEVDEGGGPNKISGPEMGV